MLIVLAIAGFSLGAVGGAIGQFALLLRLRRCHSGEWRRICGRNFLHAGRRVLRYAWAGEWRALGDRRVAQLVWLLRSCHVVTVASWVGLMIFVLWR